MVLLNHIIEVFHAPELAVFRHNLLHLLSAKGLRVRCVFIDADREREAAMLRPHQLLKEAFRRGNISLGAERLCTNIQVG